MNKENLLAILAPYIEESTLKDNFEITEISSNLQGANASQLIFYKLQDNEKSLEIFLKRLEGAKPGLLILNKTPPALRSSHLVIKESNFLAAQKKILDVLYPLNPSLKLIGITGTNGKTTTVNLAQQISEQMGHPAISFGTLGICKNGNIIEDLGGTTPSYVELRKLLHRYAATEEAIFFEVSSHALVQERLYDLRLDASAWTSFSQDHLDYHQNMQDYFEAKTLVYKKFAKSGTPFFAPHREKELLNLLTKAQAPYRITKTLQEFGLKDWPPFFAADFNQSNLELALELNAYLWNTKPQVDLARLKLPQGRFATIEFDQKLVVIDYAHTPDALENICKAIKRSFPERKLHVIFGCGGNRDKTKRPLMGEIAERYADKLSITSDNPRDEIPEEIISQILAGLKKGQAYHDTDRTKTIEKALGEAQKHEIILIAGKGHEDYQEIKGVKYPYSDFDVVERFKAKS